MALADQTALANNVNYQNRVRAAISETIANVLQENSSTDTQRDIKRRRLALNYINNPEGAREIIIEAFILLTVTNAAIEANADNEPAIADSQIQTAVNNFVNRVAGINVNNPGI